MPVSSYASLLSGYVVLNNVFLVVSADFFYQKVQRFWLRSPSS